MGIIIGFYSGITTVYFIWAHRIAPQYKFFLTFPLFFFFDISHYRSNLKKVMKMKKKKILSL